MKVLMWIVFLASVILTSSAAYADSYEVSLYYDNGTLVFDRNVQSKVAVIPGGTGPIIKGDFKAQVLSRDGSVLQSLSFDPRPGVFIEHGGFQTLDKGEQVIRLPYAPTGTLLKIFNSQNVQILEYDLSALAKCDQDNVCEGLRGETTATCPQDCKVTPTEVSPSSTSWLWWIISGLVLGGAALFVWRKYKHTNQSLS